MKRPQRIVHPPIRIRQQQVGYINENAGVGSFIKRAKEQLYQMGEIIAAFLSLLVARQHSNILCAAD